MLSHALEYGITLGQFVERAAVGHLTVRHEVDGVTFLHRCQPMGNHDDGFLAGEVVDGVHDQLLSDAIEGTRGFVQNQDIGIMVKGSGNADALTLPSRELHTSLAHSSIQAIG